MNHNFREKIVSFLLQLLVYVFIFMFAAILNVSFEMTDKRYRTPIIFVILAGWYYGCYYYFLSKYD